MMNDVGWHSGSEFQIDSAYSIVWMNWISDLQESRWNGMIVTKVAILAIEGHFQLQKENFPRKR